jgi:hypothetical protein
MTTATTCREAVQTALGTRSAYWLAQAADVPYSRVHGFLHGSGSVTSRNLDRMFAALGVTLRVPKPPS